MYEALYSPTEGQVAFRCKVLVAVDGAKRYCGKVTKSFRGMKQHAWLIHGLRQQVVMDSLIEEALKIDKQVEEKGNGEKVERGGSEQPKPIRVERSKKAGAGSATDSSGGGKDFLSLFREG